MNHPSILAFDFEWHPSMSNKIAIGQFVCANIVYIIDSYHMTDSENLEWIDLMETFAARVTNQASPTTSPRRVLVGFGVDSDLKMLSKMKRRAVLHCNNDGNSSSSSRSRNPELVLHNKAGGTDGGLFDLQTQENVAKRTKKNNNKGNSGRRKKKSLADLVLKYFPGKSLNKTCTMTNWLRRPLGQPQLEYAALDAIVCLLMYQRMNAA